MNPEKQNIIHDLLGDDSRREAVLFAGGKILRRRRHWRAARQTFVFAVLMAAIVWTVEQKNQKPVSNRAAASETRSAAPFQAQSLTDKQLLDLFPDTPVGLATLPNGKKLLIFPRPGDDEKFITRL